MSEVELAEAQLEIESERAQVRRMMAANLDAFRASGGRVQVIAPGVTGMTASGTTKTFEIARDVVKARARIGRHGRASK